MGVTMNITICIGSSCHLKGSRNIVEKLQELINLNQLTEKVNLSGTFCMGDCQNGVCVKINEEKFSVLPENLLNFFDTEIKLKVI